MATAVPIENSDAIAWFNTELAESIGGTTNALIAVGIGVAIPAARWGPEDDLLFAMRARCMAD
jgi:hypothetical protein